MKYLIFDFDGVLGNTAEARIEVLKEMEGKSDEQISLDTDQYFSKSTHTRDLGLSKEQLDPMHDWVNRYGTLLSKKSFNLFDEFIGEIKKIQEAKIAVVSSGSFLYIKPKLEKSGLNFTHILTFEDHHSKEEKVEQICKDWNISVSDAYFFTDTISDVKELESIMDKNKIYGCAWGYQGAEKLSTALDESHILNNFSDIQKVFEK